MKKAHGYDVPSLKKPHGYAVPKGSFVGSEMSRNPQNDRYMPGKVCNEMSENKS